LYFQLLIAASLVWAGYQDVRARLVSDLSWIPAIAGAALVIYFDPSLALFIKLALIGGVGFAFTRIGAIGEADTIAFVFIVADSYPLSPIPVLIATAVVIGAHVAYLFATGYVGKERVIPLAQFKREARWIPRAVIKGGERKEVERNVNISRDEVEALTDEEATVQVQYGVPDVAYIAAGYVAYLVYLIVLHPGFFFSFP
jgi:hypothetical protein